MKPALAGLVATGKTTEARSGPVFELDNKVDRVCIEFESLNWRVQILELWLLHTYQPAQHAGFGAPGLATRLP